MYSNISAIDPYTIKSFRLEHKKYYNIYCRLVTINTFTFYHKSIGTFYYAYKTVAS